MTTASYQTRVRLPQDFHAERRQALLAGVPDGSVILVPGARETARNHDVHHPFRQDSDFRYLTGFPEPDALAVLAAGDTPRYVLFCRPRDPDLEVWNGRRAGVEGARARYMADEAWPVAEIAARLPDLLAGRTRIYHAFGHSSRIERELGAALAQLRGRARQGVEAPSAICDLTPVLSELRLHKSESELDMMRRAAAISGLAHRRAMTTCQAGLTEYALEAELLHTFVSHGAVWSYPPIVGSGDNATILHYTENEAELRDGDLVLIDAGCEVDGYAADITRTFPVSGRFSDAQRALYEVVLAAQSAALREVTPGRPFGAFHDAAVQVLTEGLVELGLLQGETGELIETEAYRRFYMHRTGHWLGLDVHDAGSYRRAGEWRALEPGMVVTVEPGLYVAHGAEGVDPRWWGIGIRIEDDVAVTADGHENLTASVPKSVADIETLMAD